MRKPLGKARSGLVAALDIGSSKVCCFVAKIGDPSSNPLLAGAGLPSGSIRVAGIGHQVSRGVKAGRITDVDQLEASILNAVHAAEKMAGAELRSVLVNISGGWPASQTVGVEVSVAGHEVGDSDLRRVLDQWRHLEDLEGQDLIHSIPIGFTIDGTNGIRDPRGMFGETLGAHMHVVTANSGAVRTLSTVLGRCHLDMDALVVSPYASGLSCLVDDEMDLGVTVIDMGGGTTSFAVFFDGNVVYTDCIPVGGHHVTNDIARGFSTPILAAERIKTLYGSALPSPLDDQETIDVPPIGEEDHVQPNHVSKSLLVGIIRPRLEETFELVRSRLEASGFDKIAGRRVVLTGGASQLPGARELAQLILDKQVRMGRPIRVQGLAEAAGGPAFSTCAGLLVYAANPHLDTPRLAPAPQTESTGLFGRMGSWLKEHF
ncbi:MULTISPECIES: cell division protein FtsA [Thalassobaculum]|uniref:Cell division protein FtsA n=1 Tax=Thalassobaculum litoreum DSM 18839 TaxID=1123362 RepID=A0A8G2BJP4_9PROT|nr:MULTISPECIES: cell division protein FtsA [Thalassobaculum]SDF86030.1 cell division protein FtsA [Thalassobaculum litoreum DSM 18839]